MTQEALAFHVKSQFSKAFIPSQEKAHAIVLSMTVDEREKTCNTNHSSV
jgi:hypothetical protein